MRDSSVILLILASSPILVAALPAERTHIDVRAEPAQGSWTSVGCVTDGRARALDVGPLYASGMTPAQCQALCNGYQYVGVELFRKSGSLIQDVRSVLNSQCGNTLTDGLGTPVPASECNSRCQGGGSLTCGGFFRMNLYSFTPDGCPADLTAATATPTSYTPCTPPIAQGNREKRVWAHHVVANTGNYNAASWSTDILQARKAQIDGFFLSIGTDWWQPAKVALAYSAAQDAGFKMSLSFDMSRLQCNALSATTMRTYLNAYVMHSAAAKYGGRSVVTTTGGEACGDDFWASVLAAHRDHIYWIPAFGVGPSGIGSYAVDGAVGWATAWPTGASDINTARDLAWLQALPNKGYIPTISPWFFVHLAQGNSVPHNEVRRGDNWLFNVRWEQLMGLRDRIDHVLIASWNDYAQSTYIGDRIGVIPPGATSYANYAHTDMQSLSAFYGFAWHNGRWPAILRDQAWFMSRSHSNTAVATNDALGPPAGRFNTDDNFYVQVHLLAPANITLCAGPCSTRPGQAGVNRFSQPLQLGQSPSIRVDRAGEMVFGLNLLFSFTNTPEKYNYNYIIASSSHI